jgi:hypothetical protein
MFVSCIVMIGSLIYPLASLDYESNCYDWFSDIPACFVRL